MYHAMIQPGSLRLSWRGLLIRGPSIRLPSSPVHPMLFGTRGAAALLRYGGRSARYAEALFDGLPPSFLGVEAVLLPAVRALCPSSLVLEPFLALRFNLGCGEFWPSLGLSGLRLTLLRRCPFGAFLRWLTYLGFPREVESEIESSSFHPPTRGNQA